MGLTFKTDNTTCIKIPFSVLRVVLLAELHIHLVLSKATLIHWSAL